ncbi:signal peptide peptidase-domain-containing protein [Halenospora varia]|nr:signal peptide peptidase-domain-containing protein [Halenospora varia]
MASSMIDKFFENFQGDSPVIQSFGYWGHKIYEDREIWKMQAHLIVAALFPIYIGSHASLRRPPSAEAPKKSKDGDDEEDDEIQVEPTMEGFSPSDAIMFPIMAGCTLAVLYFIIKWLKDPRILNLILTWYFSILGVFGVGKLAADALNVATTFIFPLVWSSRKETYHVDQELRKQLTGNTIKAGILQTRKAAPDKSSPLAGPLSAIPLPRSVNSFLWNLRALVTTNWILRGYIHNIVNLTTRIRLNDAIGLVLGFAAIVLYNTIGKVWWLTNLIGFGFCYGTLQLMSPTTFWTGSLILIGLFFYDITMVFYTPLMVTVATSLDVPIKLVFPGPKNGGMLGLGDVVLPGIMMALALRFDLYLHYLRQQRLEAPLSLKPQEKKLVKTKYQDATGLWGERFWTSNSTKITEADGARFPKTYFYASVVGYIIGILTTLVVLNIFRHAQPALLYLVPGVLIALWSTALFRGELSLMWGYTEDGSLEENWEEVKAKREKDEKDEKEGKKPKDDTKKEKDTKHAHHVVLFSISEPKRRKVAKVESESDELNLGEPAMPKGVFAFKGVEKGKDTKPVANGTGDDSDEFSVSEEE